MSVSLYFEKEYNWTGLLVEANPMDYEKGLEKNRKGLYVNTCLGVQSSPHTAFLDFSPKIKGTEWTSMAGLSDSKTSSGIQMQCLPLYSLIQAAGNPTVNLLILDIEGAELAVLKTVPWDKVDIQVMTVETDLVGDTGISGGSQETIRNFIISQGYRMFRHKHNTNFMTGKDNNDLFVREDIVKLWNIQQLIL
ncbi:protein Star [Eurytemora carolleeae]|uniref:protein Star n=1 Tax=Eurytemora carolleeae TaxID=1294199 RepID=UPI000C78BE49|nr:protein Star [Eurytemora carolleeae]|eukprot:XP_023336284.1 protein Star-like [Eurytemora affinis]